ncbi:MAG TPA: hypothetical protein VN175_12425 [Rhizomicrobium sp.]|nr:hypothetical protein [Rhizomicrobium sp.]
MEQTQAASRTRAETPATQLLITFSDRDKEVVRVETVDKSGKKQELQNEDFATLAGDHDVEDLLPVLEQAYMAGFSDGNSDVFESGDGEAEADEDDLEKAVIRGVASQKLIRRGVRKLILARLLRRELLRKQGAASTVPQSETSH